MTAPLEYRGNDRFLYLALTRRQRPLFWLLIPSEALYFSLIILGLHFWGSILLTTWYGIPLFILFNLVAAFNVNLSLYAFSKPAHKESN